METVSFGLRAQLAARLERGSPWWSRWLSGRVVRPLPREQAYANVRIVTVGGATLGGSHKTPLVRALATELAKRGARVAVVAHGYRASRAHAAEARFVDASDALSDVGDDALYLARALPARSVVLASSRRAALVFAARAGAHVVVLDGALAFSPRRADVRVLALDARDPWGAGDRIASPYALTKAATHVVHVTEAPCDQTLARAATWRGARVGVVTTIARPERFLRALAAYGVHPVLHARFGDHDPLSRTRAQALGALARSRGLEAWVATEKCMLHLLPHAQESALLTAPPYAWETRIAVPAAIVTAALGHDGSARAE